MKKILINLSKLEYVSSARLRAILATIKRMTQKGSHIVFTELQGHPKEVINISGFQPLMEIKATDEHTLYFLRKK
jgi:stage II sporulation protein AA (anti-sigma F factor antagonist)